LLEPPAGDELSALYTSGFYGPGPARAGRLIRELHRLNNAIRLRELRDVATGRLLDVGCGKGRFLAAARDAGWQVLGVEFSPTSAAAARLAHGVDVVSGDFLEAPLEGDFDVITMWHVLEHLPDPAAAIGRAAELLRPGGRLVVSVPNVDSLQARLGGERWFHLDLPRHLFHFGPRSLSAMVGRAGFHVTRIGHFYPEMEVIGLVQTALNRVGIERDLLYRFAKRDPQVTFGPPVYGSLAFALGTLPVAVAWSSIAPALRTGASIQLVAHRD
jgi:SAM-dependent methyltransferase